MTVLTVAQFTRSVDELLSDVQAPRWRMTLVELYTWAHGAGLELAVQEQARIRSTSPSTPTESIAASKAHIRRSMELAERNLKHAREDFEEALHRMLQAIETLDPVLRPELLRYPRTATNGDLEEARSARDRRRERGEAIP